MHAQVKDFVVLLYRVVSISALYLVLLGVVSYIVLLGFYATNSSWAAPLVIRPTDGRGLDLAQRLLTTKQSLESTLIDVDRLKRSLLEMTRHKAVLQGLEPQLQAAFEREREHDSANAPILDGLHSQKLQDNTHTQSVLQQAEGVESVIDQELMAGLITKGEAAEKRASFNQLHTSFTDSRIGEVLLQDAVLQKSTVNTRAMDVLGKQAELRSEIAQLDIAISTATKQVQDESTQIQRLQDAMNVAFSTPYFLAVSTNSAVNLAFVPYDNQRSAAPGAKAYDCYLNFIVCQEVGVVEQTFQSEEHTTHPIYKTDLRGILVRLELHSADAMKSKTLFLGRKPLGF